MAAGFDRLAPVYDALARIVIGNGIRKSQLHFLNHLTAKNKLLILGGGTGWILPFILKTNPALQIDYIDVSPKMIALAKGRVKDSRVRFIVGTEENIPDTDYDCVITNFYLDLFDDAKLESVVLRIKNSLQPGACWIATDFISEKFWHKSLLTVTYQFFRVTTGLQTLKLPFWEQELHKAGGTQLETKDYSGGFIKSTVLRF
ncbi:MAG: class I SAM-dependent methyltransferase [Cyclobacteriaceae bacterium]